VSIRGTCRVWRGAWLEGNVNRFVSDLCISMALWENIDSRGKQMIRIMQAGKVTGSKAWILEG
jgi:hypothetical protein